MNLQQSLVMERGDTIPVRDLIELLKKLPTNSILKSTNDNILFVTEEPEEGITVDCYNKSL